MAAENKAEQPKRKGLKRLLIGGTLTAVAAAVFITAPGLIGSQAGESALNSLPEGQSMTLVVKQDGNSFPVVTKDNKLIRLTMEVKALDRGQYPDDAAFQEYLNSQAQFALMGEAITHKAGDIPANIVKIQQGVAERLALTVGVNVDLATGKPVWAQEGVNFSAPKITKITDAAGETVYWTVPSSNPVARALGI